LPWFDATGGCEQYATRAGEPKGLAAGLRGRNESINRACCRRFERDSALFANLFDAVAP
jgi:hypothetical protein